MLGREFYGLPSVHRHHYPIAERLQQRTEGVPAVQVILGNQDHWARCGFGRRLTTGFRAVFQTTCHHRGVIHLLALTFANPAAQDLRPARSQVLDGPPAATYLARMLRPWLTRTLRFAAVHREHRPDRDGEGSRTAFGFCHNPRGPGHNHPFEVAVQGDVHPVTGPLMELTTFDRLLPEQDLPAEHGGE